MWSGDEGARRIKMSCDLSFYYGINNVTHAFRLLWFIIMQLHVVCILTQTMHFIYELVIHSELFYY